MYRILKLFIALLLFSIITEKANSQNESPVQFGSDLRNRYIWRGVDLGGNSPSIQPWLKYNLISKDTVSAFTAGAWGAYTFSETSNQEVDLYLSYTLKNSFSITLTDYFFPGYYQTKERNQYFNYDKDSTCHILEGSIGFNGTNKIPFTFLFGMSFYGNDAHRINSNDSTGKIFMTKYIEVGYKANIKGVGLNAFIGAAIDKPNKGRGELGFYGNKTAGVINMGVKVSKSVQITDKYSLQIQASLITNPEAEKIFLVFGISF